MQCGLTHFDTLGKPGGCHWEVMLVIDAVSETQNSLEAAYEGGAQTRRIWLCQASAARKTAGLDFPLGSGLFILNAEPTALLVLNRLQSFSTFGQSHRWPRDGHSNTLL